jgi:hypothetical protein
MTSNTTPPSALSSDAKIVNVVGVAVYATVYPADIPVMPVPHVGVRLSFVPLVETIAVLDTAEELAGSDTDCTSVPLPLKTIVDASVAVRPLHPSLATPRIAVRLYVPSTMVPPAGAIVVVAAH